MNEKVLIEFGCSVKIFGFQIDSLLFNMQTERFGAHFGNNHLVRFGIQLLDVPFMPYDVE